MADLDENLENTETEETKDTQGTEQTDESTKSANTSVLYVADLRNKIVSICDNDITVFKRQRDTYNNMLNDEGNDDTTTLSQISEITTKITTISEFETEIDAYFRKYQSGDISELMKTIFDTYKDQEIPFNIIRIALTSFMQSSEDSTLVNVSTIYSQLNYGSDETLEGDDTDSDSDDEKSDESEKSEETEESSDEKPQNKNVFS